MDPAARAALADGHHRAGLHQGHRPVQPLFLKYGTTQDRESAYEMLAAAMASPAEVEAEDDDRDLPPIPTGIDVPSMPAPVERAEPSMLDKMMDNPAFKSAMRSAGTVIGREITRSIFGTGRRRR